MDIFERMLSAPSRKMDKPEKKSVSPKTRHLMIHFSDHLGKNTVSEHQKVADSKGYVWFGKIGRSISKSFIDFFKATDEPVFAFFIKTSKQKVTVFKALISDITKEDLRKTAEITNIPDYVAALPVEVGFWLKVVSFEKLPNSCLNELIVCSSRSPLVESLCSTVGVMFVEFEN